MTDPEILRVAIWASGMSVEGFAVDVLNMPPSQLEPFLRGEKPLLAAIRAVCLMIIERPAVAYEFKNDRRFR